jgi:hypothetical protein
MTKELLLFGSAFGAVFLLGFQSLCVNHGRKTLAVFNSLGIGLMNLGLYKMAPHVESVSEVAAFLIAGPIAILCAMAVHERIRARKEK